MKRRQQPNNPNGNIALSSENATSASPATLKNTNQMLAIKARLPNRPVASTHQNHNRHADRLPILPCVSGHSIQPSVTVHTRPVSFVTRHAKEVHLPPLTSAPPALPQQAPR